MIGQDVLTSEGRVLLGQEQWPHRDLPSFLAGFTESGGQPQGGSKILNDEDVPASDGRALPDPGQWPGQGPPFAQAGCTEWTDSMQGWSDTLAMRMSLGTKIECFFGEDNGLVEVLHFPELLVPREKTAYKVVHVP